MKLRKDKRQKVASKRFDVKSWDLTIPKKKRVQKPSIKKGKFTVKNVTLKEVAVDNKLLRIPLHRSSLEGFGTIKAVKNQKKTKPKDKNSLSEVKKLNSEKHNSALRSQNTINKSGQKPIKINPLNKTKSFPNSIRSKKSSLKLDKNSFKINLPIQQKENNKAMVVSNGKVTKCNPEEYFMKKLKTKHKIFYLKVAKSPPAGEGKLNYKFHQLVNDVKNMQLPTPSWKIKVIIRHNKIASIIFTNKAELERSVCFNSDDDKYHIVINNKPALLLGSPGKVDSCNDIEVLLSIVDTIQQDSSMIMFT
ncbi:uncharacterized protein [Diabrotica undecimpunctata]|uniref:uncharacterized protein n=1 Tax=Diabrotica undecimpunctata TaxID=50387 RepID=UPI003B632B5D